MEEKTHSSTSMQNSRSVSRSKLLLLKIPIKRMHNHACMSFVEREGFIQSLFHCSIDYQLIYKNIVIGTGSSVVSLSFL